VNSSIFGDSERQEQLSIDNAFHVQIVIHLESLDRGRLTEKPVHLVVIVMALPESTLHCLDRRGASGRHNKRWIPLRFICLARSPKGVFRSNKSSGLLPYCFSFLYIC